MAALDLVLIVREVPIALMAEVHLEVVLMGAAVIVVAVIVVTAIVMTTLTIVIQNLHLIYVPQLVGQMLVVK